MKTAVKSDFKSKIFRDSKSFLFTEEKELTFVDTKFYQKLLIILISLSTFLIFPESPKELGNICESYNTSKICKVW